MIYVTKSTTPLGDILLSSDGESLTGLWFYGQKYFPEISSKGEIIIENTYAIEKDLPIFQQALSWLDIYFSGVEPDFFPPLNPRGTSFRQEIWQKLLEIPYGETISYGELGAPRAVGGAVGHNPISIFIPCHRVVGKNGSLTGYAGGVDRKTVLLDLESTTTAKTIRFRF